MRVPMLWCILKYLMQQNAQAGAFARSALAQLEIKVSAAAWLEVKAAGESLGDQIVVVVPIVDAAVVGTAGVVAVAVASYFALIAANSWPCYLLILYSEVPKESWKMSGN